MRANLRFEGEWREWVLGMIDLNTSILKEDAIVGGAEAVGCSVKSASSYWQKITSIMGPVIGRIDAKGRAVGVRRPKGE